MTRSADIVGKPGHDPDLGMWLELYLAKYTGLKSQRAIARAIGVSPATLSSWYSGKEPVPLRNLVAIASVAKLDLGILLVRWVDQEVPRDLVMQRRIRSHILREREAKCFAAIRDAFEFDWKEV